MKKIKFAFLITLLLPLISFAQFTLPQGGTGLSTYTKGDIVYYDTNTLRFSKLGIGSTGECLTVVSGLPNWDNCLGNLSFGTDNQIPFMNLSGDDFDYSSALTFNGSALSTNNININSGGVLSFGSTSVFELLGDMYFFGGNNYSFSGSMDATIGTFADYVQPDANDSGTLGTTSRQWSDLYLAEGGIINFDNGDAIFTQVDNTVTLTGAGLGIDKTPGTNIKLSVKANTNNSSTSFVEYYDSTDTLRSRINDRGQQAWFLYDAGFEAGSIQYSTPSQEPGIVFFNASNTGRAQVKQYQSSGGLSIGATSGSGNPTDSFIMDTSGNVAISSGVAPSNKFHVDSTTSPQVRISHTAASQYLTIGVSSAGTVTFDSVGTTPGLRFSDTIAPTTNDGSALGTSTLGFSDGFFATGAVLAFNNTDTITHSAGLFTSNADIVVPNEAYGVGWNGNNEVPTKNAVYDEVQNKASTDLSNLTTTSINTDLLFNTANTYSIGDNEAPLKNIVFGDSSELIIGSTSVMALNSPNRVEMLVPFMLKEYTVGTLPTGVMGYTAFVTDADTPVSLDPVVGGGASIVPVFYNGTDWIVY